MKVYLVMQGEYEDRGVSAVMSMRPKAELYIKSQTHPDEYDIDEHEVDLNFDLWEQGLKLFDVDMQRDGSVHSVHVREFNLEPSVNLLLNKRLLPEGRLSVICFAKDEEEAKSITDSHRLRLIESGEWEEVL